MVKEVLAQARLLATVKDAGQQQLLEFFCQAAVATWTARLRDGVYPKDCGSDFVAAASLYALATLNEMGEGEYIQQFSAGDVTIRTGKSDAASNCLRYQAQWIMAPYLKDAFSFQGV